MLPGHAYAISAFSASSDSTAPAPPSVAGELTPNFAKDYLVVDLRRTLAALASRLWIWIGDASLPYVDFQRSIGDERARALVYPSVWLLNGARRQLIQMPAGAGTFETVPEQLEILRLEN